MPYLVAISNYQTGKSRRLVDYVVHGHRAIAIDTEILSDTNSRDRMT